MPVRNKEHQKLVDDLLFAFGSEGFARVWIEVVGFDKLLKICYGKPGECDIEGIIAPWGFYLGIEAKTGEAVLNPDQARWRAMIEKMGGIHIEARSVEQAMAEFKFKLEKKMDELRRSFID